MTDLENIKAFYTALETALRAGDIRLAKQAIRGLEYATNCLKTDLELRPKIVKSIYNSITPP